MPRQIALLRGVNVGGHKRVEMARLRSLIERLGCTEVRTYLQSGNVVFSGPRRSEQQLERALEQELGFGVPVLVRTRDELAAVVRANPLREVATDPAKYVVVFCDAKPSVRLDAPAFEPERFAVRGREVYFWAPAGLARSELAKVLAAKPLGEKSTARNWRTVEKLLALADGG